MASRRGFLKSALAVGAGLAWAGRLGHADENEAAVRSYHASLSIDALQADPELAEIVRDAGVSHVWLAIFFQGQWHNSIDEFLAWKERLGGLGLQTRLINIPLGHPTFSQDPPDYMPRVDSGGWRRGVRPDGRSYGGVSIHPPVTEANVEGLEKLKAADPRVVFLDDDFRLAPSPEDIGGCFCADHKRAFLERNGFAEERWAELIDDVEHRRYTALTKAWVSDTCDELTACFRAQQAAAAPEIELGNMVMFMGCEKAGIRLADYRGVPLRVGELMFEDKSFAPVKGKTNELFSALFHRRYVEPERAFSETTAWPPDKLSAPNMAAKLAVSTLSDVRNTMFMSGITPFPRTHWATLGPAMKKQAALHARVAGHVPRGPFKHFWGERSRWVGDSNAYSLFLALGVPFEVTDTLAADGWTFLSNWDAEAVRAGALKSRGTTLVHRPGLGFAIEGAREVAEDLAALFPLKREIVAGLRDVPYVEEDVPVACAWYPDLRAALLWNLAEQPQTVNLRLNDARRPVTLAALDTELVEGL